MPSFGLAQQGQRLGQVARRVVDVGVLRERVGLPVVAVGSDDLCAASGVHHLQRTEALLNARLFRKRRPAARGVAPCPERQHARLARLQVGLLPNRADVGALGVDARERLLAPEATAELNQRADDRALARALERLHTLRRQRRTPLQLRQHGERQCDYRVGRLHRQRLACLPRIDAHAIGRLLDRLNRRVQAQVAPKRTESIRQRARQAVCAVHEAVHARKHALAVERFLRGDAVDRQVFGFGRLHVLGIAAEQRLARCPHAQPLGKRPHRHAVQRAQRFGRTPRRMAVGHLRRQPVHLVPELTPRALRFAPERRRRRHAPKVRARTQGQVETLG
jgi:hypothetical protein